MTEVWVVEQPIAFNYVLAQVNGEEARVQIVRDRVGPFENNDQAVRWIRQNGTSSACYTIEKVRAP